MAKLIPIKVEVWSKTTKGKYGTSEGVLEIMPLRTGHRLTFTLTEDGKPIGKPDVWVELDARKLAERRQGLRKEGNMLTIKTVKVDARDAPRGPSDTEIAERQNREELAQMYGRRMLERSEDPGTYEAAIVPAHIKPKEAFDGSFALIGAGDARSVLAIVQSRNVPSSEQLVIRALPSGRIILQTDLQRYATAELKGRFR